MKIDFDEGEAGFFEARAVIAVVRAARTAELDDNTRDLLEFMADAAETHVNLPEFAELRDAHGTGEHTWPSFSILQQFWRRAVGPSSVESHLSQQRGEALERAERAEQSAFEALAETAKVARERDQAVAEAARLRREVDALEAERLEKGLVQTGD